MDDTKCAIAIVNRLADDAKAENIRELLEADRFALHLAPNRIGPLAPPFYLSCNATVGELPGQFLFDFGDQALVALGQRIQPRRNDAIGVRIELPKRQVL